MTTKLSLRLADLGDETFRSQGAAAARQIWDMAIETVKLEQQKELLVAALKKRLAEHLETTPERLDPKEVFRLDPDALHALKGTWDD